LVSVDPFLTATGQAADYVLPAATFAEGVAPPPPGEPAASYPLLPEQHDSLTDWTILIRLAKALDLGHYFPWATLEEALAAPRVPYMIDARHTLLADRLPEGTRPAFPSASGKIEIFSRALEQFGYDPLPEWHAPGGETAPGGGMFPLILVTGPRERAYVNSQFHQIPPIALKSPRPTATVHPDTARRAGLADGDRVAVVSPHGRIVLWLSVTERVHPECVVVPAGWSEANANLLTHDAGFDPITGFPALRSGACRLEAAPEGPDPQRVTAHRRSGRTEFLPL
jgi:anaerobic selenocysteine-containing dehydrogenase